MSQHILIVEDEVKIASLIKDYLLEHHYKTNTLHDGNDVIPWLAENTPDLVLLDIMLPGKSGLDICREIRQVSSVPIIFLTARVEEIDRLLGLELGADDYICKPFSPREVVARVKAILRRTQHDDITENINLALDNTRLKATFMGQDISLTAVEFKLLDILFNRPGQIFSRQQLMDVIYDDHRIVSNRTIDSHVKKLRKKLGKADHIQSVYGVGYKYEYTG